MGNLNEISNKTILAQQQNKMPPQPQPQPQQPHLQPLAQNKPQPLADYNKNKVNFGGNQITYDSTSTHNYTSIRPSL